MKSKIKVSTKSISPTHAQEMQRKHWETVGQIRSMISLCQYILSQNQYLPDYVRDNLVIAESQLQLAYYDECQNNEFINLKLPRGF